MLFYGKIALLFIFLVKASLLKNYQRKLPTLINYTEMNPLNRLTINNSRHSFWSTWLYLFYCSNFHWHGGYIKVVYAR